MGESEMKKIYLANFLAGLSTVASVVYTLFFLSNGISQAQIGQLFAIFMISMSVFNIPTGAFADVVGHKASVVMGLFFHSLHGIIFYLFPTYPGMVIGMLSAGLGLALQTGAWSSLTYEILEKEGKVETLPKVMGRSGAYFSMAAVIGSLLGAPIFKYAPRLPFLLFFIFIGLAGIVATTITYQKPAIKPSWTNLFGTTMAGIKLMVRNQKLMGLMILTIAMTTGRMLMNQNISQPYQVSIGIDVALIGITAAIVQVIQTAILSWSYKVADKIGYETSLIVAIIVPAIAVLVMSQVTSLASLAFIFIFYAAHSFKEPVSGYLSQKLFLSSHRATMASTSSVLSSVIVGLLLPFGGKMIDIYGISSTLFLLSIWTIIIGGMGILVYRSAKS